MPRRKHKSWIEESYDAGWKFGDSLYPDPPRPNKRGRRRSEDKGLFWVLIDRLIENRNDQQTEALRRTETERLQERQRQLTHPWQRAMVELYPREDAVLPERPQGLTSDKLERLAEMVYRRLGYDAEHQGGAGDQGIDVSITSPLGEKGAVQCKQYQAKVQPNTIREMRGTLRRGMRGYIWAPNGFTDAAIEEAQRAPVVELLDAFAIMQLVEKAFPAHPATEPITIKSRLEEIGYLEDYRNTVGQATPPRRYLGMTSDQIIILTVMAIGGGCFLLVFAWAIMNTPTP